MSSFFGIGSSSGGTGAVPPPPPPQGLGVQSTVITYPVICSLGHGDHELADDAELITHYTSVHSATPLGDYRSSLAKGKAVQPPAPPPRARVTLDPLAAMGMTVSNLSRFQSAELSGSGRLTWQAFQTFLNQLGESLGNIQIDKERFCLDFFRFVLNHGGTNKMKGLGGIAVGDVNSATVQYLDWDTFLTRAKAHFEKYNFLFTMRRLQDMYENAFWQIWNNSSIVALNDIKADGTPRSREWVMTGGAQVPAYVLVPGLFAKHLTPQEREVRKLFSRVAKLDGEETALVEYLGLEGQDDVARAQVDSAKTSAEAKMARLYERSGLGRVADASAPRPWENPKHSFNST